MPHTKLINFKKVNMRSKSYWTDDMSLSIFNFQPALPSGSLSGKAAHNVKPLQVGSKKTTSHAVGTRNFI